jgi:polar amino acid transport system substrate-binding protein
MKKIFILLLFPLILHAESYTFSGGKNNPVHTISSQILVKAYARAGIEMKPLFVTLAESFQLSNSGKTDGELGRIEKIPQIFPNLRIVPVSIAHVEAVVFSKDTSLRIKKWSDLRGHKICIIRGVKFIEKATKDMPRELVVSFEEALKRLDNNETEIVVAPKLGGLSSMYRNKYKNIKMVSSTLEKQKLYHFVHKKNSHLIPVITPILKKMEQSGEIAFMRNAYLRKLNNSIISRP